MEPLFAMEGGFVINKKEKKRFAIALLCSLGFVCLEEVNCAVCPLMCACPPPISFVPHGIDI
jgi:hypothetical protein